ncbi:MAG: elongation factor P [bacterium]|nr:elongation factor P [bacterium]
MNDLSVGSIFKYSDAPFTVLKADHVQMGRGSAVVRTKIKNLLTGQVLEITFKAGDKLEEASMERQRATFLYSDDDGYHFMNTQSYEQFFLSAEQIGEDKWFLNENTDYDITYFDSKPVMVQLPKVVELTVTETEPGVRGDTAQGNVSKPAMLNTGLRINVPLFVKQGDVIRVNTERQEYIERV